MTKEEYWFALIRKNPSFSGETVTISTRSLKAIVFQAHDKGVEMMSNDNKKPQNGYKSSDLDALKSIFGLK